jgi:hypothetical protein
MAMSSLQISAWPRFSPDNLGHFPTVVITVKGGSRPILAPEVSRYTDRIVVFMGQMMM